MLMTTQKSVSHMAYLLEPGCKRREVWRDQRARTISVPNFFWRPELREKPGKFTGVTTQIGSTSADRPTGGANRARGIRDKFGVTSAAIRYARRVECSLHCPYSNLRMRMAGCQSICAIPEPAPAI